MQAAQIRPDICSASSMPRAGLLVVIADNVGLTCREIYYFGSIRGGISFPVQDTIKCSFHFQELGPYLLDERSSSCSFLFSKLDSFVPCR